MKEWLAFITEDTAIVINAIALVIIAIGTSEISLRCLRAVIAQSSTGRELRDGYLRFARWLIAGLTLQLAADIINTAIAPTWDDIGRLASIAVIRTFLNYFLERDILEAREIKKEQEVYPPKG
ncbi:MAG: DUF1622 domain-containing protein [Xanthobacteraceae bacterium]|jgi:uncharacterized membrane protein